MNRLLVFTSDIHLGKTTLAQLLAMKEEILAEVRDRKAVIAALFLLGDIGESLVDIEACLEALASLAPLRAMIPGNHDLFDTENLGSSIKRYRELLPALAAKHGYFWGEDGPIMIEDGLAVVMTPAWPRPEFVPPGSHFTVKEMKEWKREELPDGRWIRELDDASLCEEQLERFQRNLAAAPCSVRRIIAACHVPPFPELYIPEGTPKPTDGYFISPCFGEAIQRFNSARGPLARVTDVVCGHLHREQEARLNGKLEGASINVSVIESGYGKPGYLLLNIRNDFL